MPYLLFTGETYYPSGGANDLRGKFDTIEEAVAKHQSTAFMPAGENQHRDGWANILDLDTLKIVRSCDQGMWYDERYQPIFLDLGPPYFVTALDRTSRPSKFTAEGRLVFGDTSSKRQAALF